MILVKHEFEAITGSCVGKLLAIAGVNVIPDEISLLLREGVGHWRSFRKNAAHQAVILFNLCLLVEVVRVAAEDPRPALAGFRIKLNCLRIRELRAIVGQDTGKELAKGVGSQLFPQFIEDLLHTAGIIEIPLAEEHGGRLREMQDKKRETALDKEHRIHLYVVHAGMLLHEPQIVLIRSVLAASGISFHFRERFLRRAFRRTF